ncbi:MAG: cytochrome PufQ [Marinovum sp.]|nr:cytochrome PufQ [Marinovum sp.]
MTDMTSNTPESVRSRKTPKTEFAVYFAVIFLATLPLAFLTWLLQAARTLALPEKGPLMRAWSQARIITPMIFSA